MRSSNDLKRFLALFSNVSSENDADFRKCRLIVVTSLYIWGFIREKNCLKIMYKGSCLLRECIHSISEFVIIKHDKLL